MIISKIEAILIPKEISKRSSDLYLLLFFASIGEHVLPNGKRQDMYTWTIPVELFDSVFVSKASIAKALKMNRSLMLTYQYADKTLYGDRLPNDVFASLETAGPVEEESIKPKIGDKQFYSTKSLFETLNQLKGGGPNIFVDRGNQANLNIKSLEEAKKSFFTIKYGDHYFDIEDYKIALSPDACSAMQFASENDALDTATAWSNYLGGKGFEIIEAKGMNHNDAWKYLKEFRLPRRQSLPF